MIDPVREKSGGRRRREHQLGERYAGLGWVVLCSKSAIAKGTYHCDGVGGLKGQELGMSVGWRKEEGSVRGKIWTLHREISRMPRPQLRRGPTRLSASFCVYTPFNASMVNSDYG